MKNSARKARQNKENIQKKKLEDANKKSVARAEESPGKEILYQVKTRRDSDIIKAYITFTYRVLHPVVTTRLIFFGLLVAAPSIIAKQVWLKIALLTVGILMILLGLFRQYISLAITKKNDEDYKNGTEFTYNFTANDAVFIRGDEITSAISKYKEIISFYYDEDYYYLGIRNRDFFILPKSRFTIGDPSTFEDFIYKKCKKTCRWIPNNFRDQLRKRQAARQISAEKKK